METLPLVETAPEVAPPEWLGQGRYRLLHRLGRGSFGTVYRAFDTRYSVRVAIKILHRRSPEAFFRFKSEFRSLAEVSHPNLVQLYELSSEADHWFVVMEHIEGVDLARHLLGRSGRTPVTAPVAPEEPPAPSLPPSRVDPSRLRDAIEQLTRGLMALHAAHKIHRDIKPTNVLVTKDGRVVILDFGLIAEIGETPGALGGAGLGTPGYMSPEQGRGGILTTASDWYAVGAMVHEALAGSPPDDATEPIVALTRRLLDPDPARRDDGAAILRSLGRPEQLAPIARAGTGLVGRHAELASLDAGAEQAQSGPVLLRISGVSGVGKSALLEGWLSRLVARSPSKWVLRSRCLEHDDLPFKAIDGAIDVLTSRWLAEPEELRRAIIPRLESAIRMFPVLSGLETPREAEPTPIEIETEPTARERGVAVLRELLSRTAASHPIVLCIDDAQWGDADSARLLAGLLQPSVRGLLVVVLQRPCSGDDTFPAVLEEWLSHRPEGVAVRDVRLRELPSDEARALAKICVGDVATAGDTIERIVQDAGGNPFFIRQLAERLGDSAAGSEGPVPFAKLIEDALARLSTPARQLIEVVALAARPLAEDLAMRAAAVAGSDARAVLLGAERSRLIAAARSDGHASFESAHDRIREEITRLIPADTARGHHARIAGALIASGEQEPERLLPHILGSGDEERASEIGLEAAARAEAVLAFERAAEHYALVLRLGRRPSLRPHLLERRGEMLANAGRAAAAAQSLKEAAAALLDGAAGSEPAPAARALNRRSGELWLRSGYLDEGLACFREVLQPLGLRVPPSEKAALRSAIWLRLRLMLRGRRFRSRRPEEVPPEVLERLDALWGVTTSLAMLKPMSADVFQLRHLLEALAAGEPTRVLRSLVHEASFESLIGGAIFDRRCKAMIDEMERLAEGEVEPYFRAWALQGRGMVAWFHGDWRSAWDNCHRASELYRRDCRGVAWETAVCDVYRLSALTYLGRIADLAAIVPDAHRGARERGDLYATANLAFFESFVLLARDHADDAIRIAQQAIAPFPRREFLAIHYGIAYAIIQGELYREAPEAAWELVERDWPAWRASGMARVQCVRVEIGYLRARAAVSILRRAHDRSGVAPEVVRRARRTLLEEVARLEHDRIPPARALASAVRAALAHLEGRTAEAIDRLRGAAVGFDEHGMALHAGAAYHHAARLGGEPRDHAPAVAAARQLAAQGVARPEAMFHLVVAGFRR